VLFFGDRSLYYHWITQLFSYKLSMHTDVRKTSTDFKFGRGEIWDTYDRTVRHSFVLIEHDKAREEREQYEFIVAKAQM